MATCANTQISLLVSFLLIIALAIKFVKQAESSTQQVDASAIQPTFASPDKSFLMRYLRVEAEDQLSHLWRALRKTTRLFSILRNNKCPRNKGLLCSGYVENNPGATVLVTKAQRRPPKRTWKSFTGTRGASSATLMRYSPLSCHTILTFSLCQKRGLIHLCRNCEVFLLGYHLYCCDRLCSGCGIGVYVPEYLSCSTLSHSSGVSNHGLEYPWLSITSLKSSTLPSLFRHILSS